MARNLTGMSAPIAKLSDEDRDFLRAFEECTLGKTCWSHSAHIRMAWLQLERHDSYEQAMDAIRTGIMRYNSSVESVGYHETVTVAFARLIHYRRLLDQSEERTWQRFLEINPDLLSKESPILEAHYSKDLLMLDVARERYVEPDRKPLPIAGDLRFATEDDAEKLLAIYAPYVLHTSISFEVVVPSEADFRRRIREDLKVAPWLVCIVDDEVAGYAYGTKHRAREAYKWSADVSVYVAEKYQRRGIGRILYTRLLGLLRDVGYHNAFAGIALPNAASVALHESMGFQGIGIYRAVGFKHDKWHDVGWWQKSLRSSALSPQPLKQGDDQCAPLSKEDMATHAYEVLNLIVGDILSAVYLDSGIETAGTDKTFVLSLQRNKYRLIASALYRFTKIYVERIRKIDLREDGKGKAEKFNQKLQGHQVGKLRHIFEHELSQFSGEPYSPEQIQKQYKCIEKLVEPKFREQCHELAKQVESIRDSIAATYPGCGKGIDRWKSWSADDSSLLGHNANTMTASTAGAYVVSEEPQ